LFWGRYDKVILLNKEFPLFFFSRKVPLSISGLSRIFCEKLSYGIKRRFKSLFWTYRCFFDFLLSFRVDIYIEKFKNLRIFKDSYFFFKLFYFFPFFFTLDKAGEDYRKTFLSFFVEFFRNKVLYLFYKSSTR